MSGDLNLYTGSGDFAKYTDENRGFVASDFVYRIIQDPTRLIGGDLIAQVRDTFSTLVEDPNNPLYVISAEYTLPSVAVRDGSKSFDMYYAVVNYNAGSVTESAIRAAQFVGNGGYVEGDEVVSEANADPDILAETTTFDNRFYTDDVLNADANNSARSSFTGDPVSTATGNMFHEETDIVIPGEPYGFIFARTYNSRISRLIQAFDNRATNRNYWPLGPGWTHSYGMLLISNDFGTSPDAGGLDQHVSSIT